MLERLRIAVLAVLLTSCATIQEPPGGPPDLTPPILQSVTPDSGSTTPGLKNAVVFRFNEVVSERPGAALDQMFLVSPRPRVLDVVWRRDAILVKPREGWRQGIPYRITMLPGIVDLRNNKLPIGKTVVFSTGGAIPATTLQGRVIDWEGGAAAARALIEAVRVPDSLVYWDLADSTGAFSMASTPPGRYVVFATVDRNNNRRHDYREPFDSTIVTLDSAAQYTFWAFTHDSVGPRIKSLIRADSFSIRVEFNQVLRTEPQDSGSIVVSRLPDSSAVPVAALLAQATYDSIQTAARAAAAKADTTRGGANRRDTTRAAPNRGDTTRAPVNRPPVPSVPPGVPGAQQRAPNQPAPPDSALLRLLKERPRLGSSLIIRFGTPLEPRARYLVRARVVNPTGAIGESSSVLVPPILPDSTKKVTPKPPVIVPDSARKP